MLSRFAFILLFASFHVSSQIRVGADAWQDFTHPDGSGIYFDLLRKIYSDETLELKVSPFARVKNEFKQGELDIILGIYPEDVPKKLLPSWPLDREGAILAFYDSRVTKLQHISDIEVLSTSWVRGYDFNTYLPPTNQNYEVSTPSVGFQLLLSNRVNVFIDYEYNRPKKLPSYIKSYQIMPARSIYAAFRNNVSGKRLAQIFDIKMSELLRSGELKTLFGEYYSSAGFNHHVDNRHSVYLYTDEKGLLGIDRASLTQSHSSLYRATLLLAENLAGYNISYKKLYTLDSTLGDSKGISCAINVFNTAERAKKYLFTKPFMLYQGLRLHSSKQLSNLTTVNLPKLLTDNPKLKLGVHTGRSYGFMMDDIIKGIDENQKFFASSDEVFSIKQLVKNRFDIMIESPIIFDNYWPQVSHGNQVFGYELQSMPPYVHTHLACNNSEQSKQFINAVNTALNSIYTTGAFYKAQKALSPNANHQSFVDSYKESFN